jgi:arginine repressor
MPRPPPDPVAVKWALEELAKGRSTKDIAEELTREGYPVNASTVGRWATRVGAKQAHPAKGVIEELKAKRQAVDEAEPDIDGLIVEGDHLATLRNLLTSQLKRAAQADKLGNATAAQRAGKTAADLANTIAREEHRTADERDVLKIRRAQIDEAMASVLTRVVGILSRGPLLCSECGRKLSAKLAGREIEDETDGSSG